jgi:hypothetical protein
MRFSSLLLAPSFTTDSSSFRRRDLRALRRIVRTPALLPSSFPRQDNPSNGVPTLRLLFLRSADGYSLRTRREFVSALSTVSSRYNLPLSISNVRLHAGFPEFTDLFFETSHFDRVRERLQGGNSFRREATVQSKQATTLSLSTFGALVSALPALFSSRQTLSRELGRPPLLFLNNQDGKLSNDQNTPAVFRGLLIYLPTLGSFELSSDNFTAIGAVQTIVPGRIFYTEEPQSLKNYFSTSWAPVNVFPVALTTAPRTALAPVLNIPLQSASLLSYTTSPILNICSIFDYFSFYSSQKSTARTNSLSQIFTSSKLFELARWYRGSARGLQIFDTAVRVRLGPLGDIAQLVERMLCKH